MPDPKLGPNKRPSLYVIAASSANTIFLALAHLDATATLCPDRVKPGAFHPDGVVLFYVPEVSNVSFSSSIAAKVFSHSGLRLQERVAVVQKGSMGLLLSWRFNPFRRRMERSIVDLKEERKDLARNLFRPFDMDVRVDSYPFGLCLLPTHAIKKDICYFFLPGVHF